MNKRQLVALWVGVIAEIAILLFPPWVCQAGPSGTLRYERTWMWLWQGDQSVSEGCSRIIDIPILCIESIVVALAFAVIIFSIKDPSRITGGGVVGLMDLQEFVTKTLVGIVAGVVDAQHRLAPLHAQIVPDLAGARVDGGMEFVRDRGGRPVRIVKFDVAVASQTKKGTQGGITVPSAYIGGGILGRSSIAHEAMNRIQFDVPVAFPMQVETEAVARPANPAQGDPDR